MRVDFQHSWHAMPQPQQYVDPLSKLIRNASLDFHFLRMNHLSAEGFMYINERRVISPYFGRVGKAATGTGIAPKRTGFCTRPGLPRPLLLFFRKPADQSSTRCNCLQILPGKPEAGGRLPVDQPGKEFRILGQAKRLR